MSESAESPQVTFVAGKAVSQDEGLDSNLETDEREAAKAAVRKAIQEAGESSAADAKSDRAKDPFKPAVGSPERGPDGKFLPKDEKPAPKSDGKPGKSDEEPDLDPTKASVKELLKARERVAQLKKSATDEISQERARFEQERQAFQREMAQLRAEAQQLARERQAIHALKNDPARAIRELGLNPEEYILQLAQEGTPEGQAARKQREIDAQLAEIKAWREAQQKQAEQAAYQAQVQQIAQFREQAVQQFTALGTNEEKYPHTATFFKGNERALVAWGDMAAEEYRHLSGGKEGSYEDILDYIEDQLAERANSWYTKRGTQKVEPSQPKVQPAKSKGVSLSPDMSGERRALEPKNLQDLDGDERLAAAKEAVAIALAASRQTS